MFISSTVTHPTHTHTHTHADSKKDQRKHYALPYRFNRSKLPSREEWQHCHSNQDFDCNTTTTMQQCFCVCVLVCTFCTGGETGNKSWKCLERCATSKRESEESSKSKANDKTEEHHCTRIKLLSKKSVFKARGIISLYWHILYEAMINEPGCGDNIKLIQLIIINITT